MEGRLEDQALTRLTQVVKSNPAFGKEMCEARNNQEVFLEEETCSEFLRIGSSFACPGSVPDPSELAGGWAYYRNRDSLDTGWTWVGGASVEWRQV